jgi:ATP-dependent Lhr-like helicase
MLLTRRLERARLRPLGFVANEYALAVWGSATSRSASRAASSRSMQLFDEDMLGDDLEAWLAESALMKRTFRNCAIIAGLIERRFPARKKQRRQVTISTDLVYDVLRATSPTISCCAPRGRRRDRPPRHQAARRNALAHQGPNRP